MTFSGSFGFCTNVYFYDGLSLSVGFLPFNSTLFWLAGERTSGYSVCLPLPVNFAKSRLVPALLLLIFYPPAIMVSLGLVSESSS